MKKSLMDHFVFVLIGLIAMQLTNVVFAAQEGMAVSHRGIAIVKMIDKDKGIVKLAHDSIPSINWPAMTMNFRIENSALLQGIKVNDAVDFIFIQSDSDYAITYIKHR